MLLFTGLEISCPQHPGTEQKTNKQKTKKKIIKRIRKAKTEDLHCHADLIIRCGLLLMFENCLVPGFDEYKGAYETVAVRSSI